MFRHAKMLKPMPLNGLWRFHLEGDATTHMPVPAAWETRVRDKTLTGPATYSRAFRLPATWLRSGQRITLECDAISFAARAWCNDIFVGEHTGMWSLTTFDLTHVARAGRNSLRMEVSKPGGTAHPLRETLSGFLPDVATTFGGLWQGVRIVCSPETTSGRSPDVVSGAPTWRVRGTRIERNGQPVHLRGILDWGWNPARIAPNRTRAEAERMIRQCRALGFNLIKLCLYVPDVIMFDACAAHGMAIWLELPLWQAALTPAAKALALREYADILQRMAGHPELAVLSLGCELDAQADAAFLRALHRLVRRQLPGAIFIDNSGSAEAYAGVRTELAQVEDFHFYADPHFFDALCDRFARGRAPTKPWLFGEFCDADTGPDPSAITSPEPWWLRDPLPAPDAALAGARTAMRTALDDANTRAWLTRLQPAARAQSTAVRKFVLERLRTRHASGGYVLTGWQDTPITTSGIVDHAGRLKFSARAWRAFNADRVLVLDAPAARAWTHGGDRPAHIEPYCIWDDQRLTRDVLLSNGGEAMPSGRVCWRWREGQRRVHGEWGMMGVKAARVGMIGTVEIAPSKSAAMREARLTIEVATDGPTPNPSPAGRGERPALLAPSPLPPGESLSRACRRKLGVGFPRQQTPPNSWPYFIVPQREEILTNLATHPWHDALSPALLRRIRAGAHALLWQQTDAAFTSHMPFWREAIHTFAPHPLWRSWPTLPVADLRMFGIASDLALDLAVLQRAVPDATITPIWRRFDARRFIWHAYLAELRIGKGRLMVSTLRFAGGHGDQPDGFAHNPLGAFLLHTCATAFLPISPFTTGGAGGKWRNRR